MNAKNKDARKAIKEYEKSQREAAQKLASNQEETKLVDFDQWWLERANVIKQPQYIKEILKADAKGRGLTGNQSYEKWDWAAKQFGLSF